MNRRDFLFNSSKMVAVPLLSRLAAAPLLAQSIGTGYRAVVCVYLYGGNDGNNTLIPTDSHYAQYTQGRGTLVLPVGSLNKLNPGSRSFGLHPSLKNMASLYNEGHSAWLVNAGPLTAPYQKGVGTNLPQNLFSHAGQATEWQSAMTQTDGATGWAGRIAEILSAQTPSAAPVVISTGGWQLLGASQSVEMGAISSGGTTTASVINALEAFSSSLSAMDADGSTNRLTAEISRMKSGHLSSTKLLLQAQNAGAAIKTTFPTSALGRQLKSIAQMINGHTAMDASRQIFMANVVGYDTHVDQLRLQANNLADLDASVGAFANAMQEIGMFDQVTLFTMTDFSRSHQANSTNGTDHAWGNHHLIVGGAVQGGSLYGTFPDLIMGGDSDFGNIGLWIPTTSGSQYAATVAKWLGLGTADLATIFPELKNFPQSTLGFLG